MKGCPACKQLYAGEQIRFCRWDGSTLQTVVVGFDEAAARHLPRQRHYQLSSEELTDLSGELTMGIKGKET